MLSFHTETFGDGILFSFSKVPTYVDLTCEKIATVLHPDLSKINDTHTLTILGAINKMH